jgi:hypothetical protein
LEFQRTQHDLSTFSYIWEVGKWWTFTSVLSTQKYRNKLFFKISGLFIFIYLLYMSCVFLLFYYRHKYCRKELTNFRKINTNIPLDTSY